MNFKKTTPLLLVTPIIAVVVAGFLPSKQESHFENVARTISAELPRQHLSRRVVDADLSRRMLDHYLSSYDPERIYFLADDIARFKKQQDNIANDLQHGKLDFAGKVFEILKQRVSNRQVYVEALLEETFDFTGEETYRWNRRDAEWAENEEAWDHLWRQRIKNEYLRRLIAQAINEDDAETETDENGQPDVSPSDFILNRYTQYLHILNDNDSDWVVQKYLSAFAKAFDPHCDYLSPAATEDFEIEMKLSLVGIGALLRPEDGAAKIVSLIPGGPAATDERDIRLRPGDKIIAVGQDDEPPVSVLHWPLYRTVRLIRGEIGTRVVLTVIPATDPTGSTTKTVDLIRDEVKLEEREVKSRIETVPGPSGHDKKVGVIVVPAFYADVTADRASPDFKSSSGDVGAILRTMREESVDGVILDLRNNGGGSLIEAVLMTGLFIESGPVVQVRERRSISILPDNDPTIAYKGPLIVLVNRISASASEILAAALQDYGRAIVIGDSRTHGKGSVQSVRQLGQNSLRPNNSEKGSIKVTSALFYRITGGSTQLKGVEPDIVIPSPYEFMELGEDSLTHPLEWSTIRPVMFSPFDDLSANIVKLRERSEERREEDESYQAYLELLHRIEAMNLDKTISLNFEQRIERAQTERELLDIQNQLMDRTADGTEDENGTTVDKVAEKAMRIMADFVHLHRHDGTFQKTLEEQQDAETEDDQK